MIDQNPVVIGLAAHPRLRNGPTSPLIRLFHEFEPFIVEHLRPQIVAVDGTYRSLKFNGLLHGYDNLEQLRAGGRGGFVELAERVVMPRGETGAVDHVIYLIDPLDPTSLYPETLAIKRECVVKRKFFASTFGAAHEWLSLKWMATETPDVRASLQQYFCPTRDSRPIGDVALIAHDSKKADMLAFVSKHHNLLNDFKARLSTGTTGHLLNGLEPERLRAEWAELEAQHAVYANAGVSSPALDEARRGVEVLKRGLAAWRSELQAMDLQGEWVTPLQTGSQGGDVQVAAEIVRGSCSRVFFFEDPLVSREHETDIQVFERAARIPENVTACYHDLETADEWACMRSVVGWSKRSIVRAFRDEFNVHCVLATRSKGTSIWQSVVDKAGWHVFSEINHRAREEQLRGKIVRVGVSWGSSVGQVVEGVARAASDDIRRANDRTGIPRNLEFLPTIGLVGHTIPGVEANANACDLADIFKADCRRTSYYAFVDQANWVIRHPKELPNEKLADWSRSWEDLDIAVFTCCPLRGKLGAQESAAIALPAGLTEAARDQGAVAEVGGLFLSSEGREIEPPAFFRFGATFHELRKVAERGGSILIAGADLNRLDPAVAALEAGLVSVFVTDVDFARAALDRRLERLHAQNG